ncbi:2,4-dienoyl-CoA reductase-like NADH-dependent reductase (Old Yellow Enzyme family) [Kribbella sp. VKM Ac-2527]|uniref:2,4-dienoyl-CoA reductase-like NADH-dependent reductase (Old Yellow Enzyme family) n=1 Tax=Kribbella caucasensis TaxID=2512215 RepID=A0A4R6KE03_9ACTN|nr:FAD-dependent oxidoreductase [Kribbella sp. VKM Ac-2527]TDO48701.1 2,4-dienoyl-CoA reductase-like NADH-dependent reductase (Old Yellow Enzyme family) [Kribbella sp. VKM Ac-2527]
MTAYPHLFSPIEVGTMRLRNRVMMPPHASAIGNIWGTEDEARRNIAYFERRCKDDGVAWVGSLSTHLRNKVVPGFDPTGVGAATVGHFRLPYFVERVQQFCDALHDLGTAVTVQMVHQGGMPHAPSAVMSAPTINLVPHVMTEAEIAWFVREYAESARLAQLGRADGVELHLNHEDLHEWFLSPYTNQRTDSYGGSLENRARFAVECLRAIRETVGASMTLGIRLNLREELPEGYDLSDGVELAQYFESTGLVDYVHGVIGSPWGNPSYIQPTQFEPGAFAPYAGELKRALSVPVVHTGRITDPAVAESVLAAGYADIVGMARAHIADGDLLAKAREGRTDEIRPCVGGNDCISRRYVEGLSFACAVNPGTSHEVEGPWLQGATKRRLLVVGGGPAGLELAALAKENGLDVTLWEAETELGGQLRYVAQVPRHEGFAQYLEWQIGRLKRLGVDLATSTNATPDQVRAFGADVTAIATGAHSRVPAIPGVDAPHVVDSRDVLAGRVSLGHRVLVIAEDDHVPPLSVADYLAEAGHEVTLVHPTNQPAPLVGRYSIGAILGRLDAAGVTLRSMEQVVAIERHTVLTRNVYSWRTRVLGDFDSVVLACGSVSESSLYDALRDELRDIHVLGDAYAPRRLVFATQQAYALAKQLVTANRR